MRSDDPPASSLPLISSATDLGDVLPRSPLLGTGPSARPTCPACGGPHLVRWGAFAGRRRQRCRSCRRTFSDFTGTWLARGKRPALWPAYVECMRQGLSVRAAAARLGIHKDTAWRWRHRMLAEHLRCGWQELRGTLEIWERMTLVNQKGERGLEPLEKSHRDRFRSNRARAWLLITRDRDGHVFAQVMGGVLPRPPDLHEVLFPRCARVDWILARRAVYSCFAASHGLRCGTASVGYPGSRYSIAYVFEYDWRMRAWLVRFCGVATRYLDRYLRWYALLDRPPGPEKPHLPAPRWPPARARVSARGSA